jgi:DNA-binding MarR family transcriptional regulator
MKQQKLGPLETVLGFHLRRASFIFSPDLRKTKGIAPGWLSILSVVSANPKINQAALSRTLGIDPANLTPVLDTLVEKKLLTRNIHPTDRRARVLSLAPAGKKKLQSTISLVRALEVKMLAGFTREERETLTMLLKRIHMPPPAK